MTRRQLGILTLCAYVGTIFAANYAVNHYGIVSVPFGLVAPAGVYFAGLALVLRNSVQRTLGRLVSVLAILAGAGLSWWISPTLATASAAAFLFSELADFSVFTPLQRRGWTTAALAGGTAGAAIDSAIFLQFAFHSQAFWRGQFVGKMTMIIPAVILWALLERSWRSEQAVA